MSKYCARKFGSWLSAFDIFGKKIEFQLEGKTKYQTYVGGILAIGLFSACIVSFAYFGSDLFNKTNPKYSEQKEQLKSFPMFTLNSTNFFLGFRVEDDNGGYVTDPRYFTLIFMYDYYKKNNETKELVSGEPKEVSYKPCQEVYPFYDNATLEDISSFHCPIFDFLIGGEWTQDSLGLFTFYLKRCDSATEKKHNITCATQEEAIKKYNNMFYIGIKYYDNVVNPSERVTPIQRVLQYNYMAIDAKMRKQFRFFYSSNVLSSDFDPVMKVDAELDIKEFLQFEKFTGDFMNVKSDNYNFEFGLYITNLKTTKNRSYMKLQDVTAQVGGLLSFFFFCIEILYEFLIGSNLKYFMYKKLYLFKCYDKQETKKFEGNENETPSKKLIAANTKILEVDFRNEDENTRRSSNVSKRQNRNTVSQERLDPYGGNSQLASVGNNANTNSGSSTNNKGEALERKGFTTTFKPFTDVKKSHLLPLNYNRAELWCFQNCYTKKAYTREAALKNQVFYFAQKDLENKLDILKLFNRIDQLNLLSSVVMNNEQEYMLRNSGKKIVYNEFPLANNDFDEIDEYLKNYKIKRLKTYLLDKKEKNLLEPIDLMLFKRLSEDIKSSLNLENFVPKEEFEDLEDDIENFIERWEMQNQEEERKKEIAINIDLNYQTRETEQAFNPQGQESQKVEENKPNLLKKKSSSFMENIAAFKRTFTKKFSKNL